MVYKGFTWNLTARDAAKLRRVCMEVLRVGSAKYVEEHARDLLALMQAYDETRTDGKTPPQYLYADS